MKKPIPIQQELRKLASPAIAGHQRRFFKTGTGQYSEGDRFLGIKVPAARSVAKKYRDLADADLKILLRSEWHEERFVAGQILVMRYQKAKNPAEKKRVLRFYLQNRQGLNNWDLVDSTAYFIPGHFAALTGNNEVLLKLAASKRHWDRRTAVVATLALIRNGDTGLIYQLAEKYLTETEDLMHKAVGWMLREAGKKDAARLRAFIKKQGPRMPRTMLRYAIEKFSPAERTRILKTSKPVS